MSMSLSAFGQIWEDKPVVIDKMLHMLSAGLANRFERDVREPIVTFSISSIGSFGIVGVDPFYCIQFFLVVGIQVAITMLVAIIIFRFILRRRGTISSFLIGYGVIVPTLLRMPFYLIEILEIKNMAFMMLLAVSSSGVLLFRVIEAMYDTVPIFATRDLQSFILYYVSPVQFQYNRKTQEVVRLTRNIVFSRLLKFCEAYIVTGIVLGIASATNYQPFPKRSIVYFFDLLYWGNLFNNYFLACLTGMIVNTGLLGLGIAVDLISGRTTIELNHRPLFEMKSPSDFWGKRWNAVVHEALKRGVYLPIIKQQLPKSIAMVSTFVASGLMHEYILLVASLKSINGTQQYNYQYGQQSLFFLWNGLIMGMEYILQNHSAVKWMGTNLPSPIITALVIMTVLPFAHLFTDEYAISGIYDDIGQGFPRIIRIS